jgi:acetyl esterase/lipase
VTKETPATFIVVNNDDNLAPASADYYTALRKAGAARGTPRVPGVIRVKAPALPAPAAGSARPLTRNARPITDIGT